MVVRVSTVPPSASPSHTCHRLRRRLDQVFGEVNDFFWIVLHAGRVDATGGCKGDLLNPSALSFPDHNAIQRKVGRARRRRVLT